MDELNDIAERYNFQSYHLVWLSVHPDRSPEWLKDKLRDGFDIHHVDGDHENDVPSNLVLIEAVDHMRLHGMKLADGIQKWRSKKRVVVVEKPSPKAKASDAEARAIYEMKIETSGSWAAFAKIYYGKKPSSAAWCDIGASLSNKARTYASRNGLNWPPAALIASKA